MTSGSEPVDIGRVLDAGHWGGFQKFVVALAALAIIFDGVDIQVLGVAIPALMKEWGFARSAFAPVIAIGLAGMACGSVIGGMLGDRFGRRRALIGSILTLGILTALSAHATGLVSLTILRFIAGLGFGGALPNASALSSEYVPQRFRPFAITLTIVCVPLGASIAGLVAAQVLAARGWPALFTIGGVAAVAVAVLLALVLPESPRYLTRHRSRWPELERLLARMRRPVAAGSAFVDPSEQALHRASVRALLTPAYRRDTLLLWSAFFACLLAVYLGFNWLPTMLREAGLGVSLPNLGLSAFNLGGVAGAIIAALLIQRLGSRTIMLVVALIAIGGALAMSVMQINAAASVAGILLMLGLTGGAINAVQTTMYALAAHIYPTEVRATGVGAAATIGRCGAIASAYAGSAALGVGGSMAFFALIAIAMAATAFALAGIHRHVTRPASLH
jgi:AAHS family 4-hydroxybenzoate transporter-like MFS transporter